MRRAVGQLAALATALIVTTSAGADPIEADILGFSKIDGWQEDDHAAALTTFLRSCERAPAHPLIDGAEWARLCGAAAAAFDPRAFFEAAFVPVVMRDGRKPLFTGYFEPELDASRTRTAHHSVPIYAAPEELTQGRVPRPWLSRAEIDEGALAGRGLELAWLSDPVEAFFLHIQGSGRLRMEDGSVMRVGFSDRNGHPYRSVGRHMAEQGILAPTAVSARNIGRWVAENGAEGRRVLHHNPSYVFFREVHGLGSTSGPIGAMGIAVTPERTVAVDRSVTPLGSPVWVSTTSDAGEIARLFVAQDVGSAINGAQRADLFFGSGLEAGRIAGTMRQDGRLVTLLPVSTARRLAGQE